MFVPLKDGSNSKLCHSKVSPARDFLKAKWFLHEEISAKVSITPARDKILDEIQRSGNKNRFVGIIKLLQCLNYFLKDIVIFRKKWVRQVWPAIIIIDEASVIKMNRAE